MGMLHDFNSSSSIFYQGTLLKMYHGLPLSVVKEEAGALRKKERKNEAPSKVIMRVFGGVIV